MKLALRVLLPAALVAGALALPSSGTATPPSTGACPDHFVGPVFLGLFFPEKDKNGDGYLCVKEEDSHIIFKDDNCNPNCDADDLIIPPVIPVEDVTDNVL